MASIQLKQIQNRILERYKDLVDVTDARDTESALKTRCLSAWVVEQLSGCSTKAAAEAVVDGFDDNGLDAVHVDGPSRTVYLVQSKWDSTGKGSMASADIHKFVQGFKDLSDAEFDRFNPKVRKKQEALTQALNDPNVIFKLVLAHSGSARLSDTGRQIVDDLLKDVNDSSEIAGFEILTQTELHAFLTQESRGVKPTLKVTLHHWGSTDEPYQAFYGQVDAADIADWFSTYRGSLFNKNLREFLGRSSEVNESLLQTLRNSPSHFWYFNNGVTVLCERVARSAIGSTQKRSGSFEFSGVSVVNGAQTVGCIGEAATEDPCLVADARVMVRFISLEGCPPGFAQEVTRGTNTQNRIERRDFVALDPEQTRIREELAIDGITYAIKSGEETPDPRTGFTVVDATLALACSNSDLNMAVQAKREIGRLWVGADSMGSASLYRRIFTDRTSGQEVWRSVRILRRIDSSIQNEQFRRTGRDLQVGVHGNRVLAHLVFAALGAQAKTEDEDSFTAACERIPELVHTNYDELVRVINEQYESNYLASLFKNATKCAEVVEYVRS